MANIRKIEGKLGTSYKITVAQGRDGKNQQRRHYMTWKVPPGMTARQADKEVQKVAIQFEQQLEQGYVVDDRQTVEEYAAYFINLKERGGAKHRTTNQSRSLLVRIVPALGHMRLRDVRPKHINDFHSSLTGEGIRASGHTAIAKPGLRETILKQGRIGDFQKNVSVSNATLSKVFHGESVSLNVAKRIAAGLKEKPEDLFTIKENKNPLSGKTLMQYHRFLSSMFQNAVNEMLIPYNPVARAKAPQTVEKEMHSFEVSEIAQITAALESEPLKWQAATYLLLITGARRGEIAGLSWDNINFDNKTIHITRSLLYTPDRGLFLDTPKTAKSRRLVSIPAEVVALLREYRSWQLELRLAAGDQWREQGFVFTQDNGNPMHPDSISGWLAKFAKRHGLPHIHAHAFRHTMASQLLSNGENLIAVSRRLGHGRTSTTTDIYAHTLAEADARAAERAADILLRGNI